ncbi:sugar phosphate isomerase/epimerase family protein [Paenibacillus paeoniae]|nr:sugar phosphate isomerase/epimerase [Paenibacillus paeoniae]
MGKPIAGIQMYSLRDEAERDILSTIEQVAEMGYKAIESIGYFNAPPDQFKKRADELGLAIPSKLISLNFKTLAKLDKDFATDVEIAARLGVSYVSIPWVPMHEQPTIDDMYFLADVLIRCGEQTKAAGMKLALHNHDYELKLVEGRPAFDRLLELVPEELMVAELDLGWVFMAGYDPAEYLKKHQSRTPLVHIRDFKIGRKDTELGKGLVGIDKLLEVIEQMDVEYMFVEQEDFLTSSLDSAKANILYLKKLGYA